MSRLNYFTLNVFYIVWLFVSCYDAKESGEALIYANLLNDYDLMERPVRNHSDPAKVELKLELQQIVDIDGKNQVMEMNVWLNFGWYDYRLTWDPAEYDGVTDIRLPPDLLWRPDILLFNSVDQGFGTTHMANILVFHNGKVEWVPPGITRSSCLLTVTWFPFDDQFCYLKFGSWSYDKEKLILTSSGTDISNYMVNGEWILLEHPTEVKEVVTHGTLHQYIYFKFHLRRRTLYFGFNLITPSLLVATLSILGFTIPADSGEKITLEITILLSICVFMNTVADVTPITESLPLLSVFFFCHMVAVTISIGFNITVLNYYYRAPKTHSMSQTTRKVLLNWLPWLLRMKRPEHTLEPPPFLARDVSIPESLRSDHVGSDCHFHIEQDSPVTGTTANPNGKVFDWVIEKACERVEWNLERGRNEQTYGKQAILLSLHQIHHELRFMTELAQREQEIENVIDDWQFASMVVDRACLVFITIFILCTSLGVLLSSPHLVA